MKKYVCDCCGREYEVDTKENQTKKTIALCDNCYNANLAFELNESHEEQEFIDLVNK